MHVGLYYSLNNCREMAANYHRLARLLRLTQVCRTHRNVLRAREFSGISVRSVNRVPCVNLINHRSKSVNAAVTPDTTPIQFGENRGIFSRFWIWLNDESDEQHVIGQEEKEEREALLSKVQDMYFAKPPVQPDLSFYKEAFRLLVKYNDKNGVETLWRLMEEMKIEPDAELLTLVEPFLEQARKNVWFE